MGRWYEWGVLLGLPRDKLFKYVKVPYTLAIDHRIQNTGLPVRSAVLKLYAGWLVVGWVTTSESQLLIVFVNVTYVSTRVMRYACAPILR